MIQPQVINIRLIPKLELGIGCQSFKKRYSRFNGIHRGQVIILQLEIGYEMVFLINHHLLLIFGTILTKLICEMNSNGVLQFIME